MLSPDGNVSVELGKVLSDSFIPVLFPDGSCFSRGCKVIESSFYYHVTMMFLVFLSCVSVGISVSHGGIYSKWIYPLHLIGFGLYLLEVLIKIGSYSLDKGNSYLNACETYLLDDKWNLVDTVR